MSNNKAFQRYLREQTALIVATNPDFTLNGNFEFIKQCRDNWKLKAEEERKCYHNDVKQVKSTKNKNALNVNVEENQFVDKYFRKLAQLLVNVSDEELLTRKFHIFSTNVLCKIDDSTYPLLEIGLVEYTIQDGIIRSYHKFVNAGHIPFGYAYVAQSHAQTTHKIPLNNFIFASNDFRLIVNEMRQMIADFGLPTNDSLHPIVLFSKEDQKEQNYGALKWLENRYAEQLASVSVNNDHLCGSKWNIEILSIADLLFYVITKMGACKPYALCIDQMDSCAFDYSFHTDCDFHESLDCIYCAIGVSKRLCYILSVNFHPIFKFEITERHAPKVDRSSLGSVSYINLHNYRRKTVSRSTTRTESSSEATEYEDKKESLTLCGIGRGRVRENDL